ncbi:MAG: RNA methyltransferase [Chloroflexi bacterium]|nr:RNA methyltransferase [Chloroflexota bacterium]
MKPQIVRINSENDQFQHIETLQRNRAKRQKRREFFIEGVRPINQALAYGWTINAFIYSYESTLSNWARNILDQIPAKIHFQLPLRLLDKLSAKEDTSEILALVAMPENDLSRIPVKRDMLTVVFDRPSSPGNLGTLIRSCDALKVDGLVLTGHAVDLYDPEVIRASTGSFFAILSVRLPSHKDLLPWWQNIREKMGDFQIVGSSARAEREIWNHDFRRPTILLIGNETAGLSAAYKDLCDAMVKIPMDGSATSLNVACAASIMLYEINRQRGNPNGG